MKNISIYFIILLAALFLKVTIAEAYSLDNKSTLAVVTADANHSTDKGVKSSDHKKHSESHECSFSDCCLCGAPVSSDDARLNFNLNDAGDLSDKNNNYNFLNNENIYYPPILS